MFMFMLGLSGERMPEMAKNGNLCYRRQVRQGSPSTSWKRLVSETADGQGAKAASRRRAIERLAVSEDFASMRPTARWVGGASDGGTPTAHQKFA
jgi:hypothetical protein